MSDRPHGGAALDRAPLQRTPRPAGPDPVAADAAHRDRLGPRAVRLTLFSVSLGVAALGSAWQGATGTVGAWLWVSDLLYAGSVAVAVLLLVTYIAHGGYRPRLVRSDVRHPHYGFTTAYLPIIGMLAASHYSRFSLDAGRWVYGSFLAAAAVVAAQLVAHWLRGGIAEDDLHPGHLLPVVSAPFVASAVGANLGLGELAYACFAVGIFYWLALGTIVLGRLITQGLLLDRARPTMTVLLIPPATGGVAWFALQHGRLDAVQCGLTGILVITLLVTAFLVPYYRQSSFHLGFWTFAFPAAATTNYTVHWMAAARIPGWEGISWAVLSVATLAFTVLSAATVVHLLAPKARKPG